MTDCYFTPNKKTTSETICGNRGLEKSIHMIGEGIKASKVIIHSENKLKSQHQCLNNE